ncbi:MAG: halocyanin precursor-like protein [Thermomicrobiales bacterium]|nr:halocyanin precursor-like protein [Thermomicrobiales bacterium]
MVGTLIVSEDAAAAPVGAATPAGSPAAPAAASPTAAGAAPQSVDVVSYDIYFEPAEVTIPANTDVTIVLPNDGVTPHNFSIDELGIDVDIAPGETQETVINAPAGEYIYYCNVPGHKEAGMVGTLIVTDDAAATGATAPAAAEQDAAAGDVTPAGATTGATPAAGGEEAAAGVGAGEAVTVESYDIYFEPAELTIPADTDVTVSLPNAGAAPHNFSIDELGISVDIAPGATEETVINAPAGTYEYYCNVPGHKEAGMVGTLTVG